MKKIGLCFSLFFLASLLFGQQQEEKKYKLMEFRNANINSVLNYISDITGMTIITHPDLKGNVTIINKEDLTQDKIIEILYSTLRDLGFTIDKQNNILTIVPLSQERIKTEIHTDEDISKLPDGAQIITYIITLKYINADSIINNIRPFMSKFGNVSVNSKMNKLILSDSASNIKKVIQIIKELDKQETTQGKETETIYLKHIPIDRMESIILEGYYDLKVIDTANPAMQKIAPRSDVHKEPTLKLVKLTEANAFLAIGNKEEIENVRNFINKIDIEVTATVNTNNKITTNSNVISNLNVNIIPNNSSNTKFVIIPLKYLSPKKMIEMINQIYALKSSSIDPVDNWRNTAQMQQRQASPLSPESRVLEFPERNSLIFIGPSDDYKKIKDLVDVFEKEIKDTGYKMGETVTKVFYLKNQKAEDIVQVFTALYPTTGDKSIIFYPDKNINSIIISAPSDKIAIIGNLMDELDKKLAQVMIKVLIAEVSFSDQSQVGVDWSSIANLPDAVKNVVPSLNVAQKFGTAATSGITIQSSGLNFILNALQTLGNVDVLSTPVILTLDTKEATINIGKQIAFISETLSISGANQDNVTTSKKAEYRNVGLTLKVKPQINDEKTVTMDINQTVNDTEASGNADYPNIITREITSTIMVGDKQTAVLGGLMETKTTKNTQQIPFLGYIPLIGYLFKNEEVKREKTELIMFITPYVILSGQDLNQVKEDSIKRAPTLSPEQIKEITN